jgi:hypothetical protein
MTQKRTFPKGLLYGLIIIAAGALLYTGYRIRSKWKKEHVLVELRPIQTPKGWGYDILADGKIFIHQPVIPAIPGDTGFRTKEDALTVGQKVVDRAMLGQTPMVTAKEVQDMGFAPHSSSLQ